MNLLKTILRYFIGIGVVAGLSLCFYAGLHGDWKIAIVGGVIYIISLVILA